MRYPGLPHPWGDDGDGPAEVRAWSRLGGDLQEALAELADAAAEAMDRQDAAAEVVARLGIAEARRRAIADVDAVELAAAVRPLADSLGDGRLVLALVLVQATAAWDAGELGEAEAALDEAEDLVGDDLDRAIVDIARARVLRYRSRHADAHRLAEGALERLAEIDADAAADARRELSACLLMQEDAAAALPLARAALDHHAATGDLYRSGMARILVARALDADHRDDRVEILRSAAEDGERIGSTALELAARLHLAQLLQTGATPESDRYDEADRHLRRVATLPLDGLARAEVALTRAHLEIGRFDPSGAADALLDEARDAYSALDNTVGMASTEKARARLLIQRASSERGRARGRSFAGALGAYLRSSRGYAAAGMHRAVRRLGVERSLAMSWASGRGPGRDAAVELLATSDPRDPHDRARSLLLAAEELLRDGPDRRTQDVAADLLRQAEALADETQDTMLRTAAAFGSAELAAIRDQPAEARVQLHRGLDLLAAVDRAIVESPGRARFVDSVDWVSRRALRAAVAVGDGRAGLYLLETRRSGRLAGLFRQRGQVSIDADVAGLLGRIQRRREVEGGPLRGVAGATGWADPPAGELREELASLTSDAFATVYDPRPVSWDELLDAVPDHVDLLLIDQLDPHDPADLVAVAARGDGTALEIHAVHMASPLLETIGLLASDDDRRDDQRMALTPADLDGLEALLPPLLAERLGTATDADLLMVPSGALWSVPWSAMPLGERLLCDAASVTVTPSLRVHGLASGRPGGPITGSVLTWAGRVAGREETLDELAVFDAPGLTPVRPATAFAAHGAIVHGGDLGAVALAVHGDAEAGLAHGVELGPDVWLRAFHLLGAELPPYVFLGACHGGFAGGDESREPVGFATVALCAGARSVIAASTKVLDQPSLSSVLADAYRRVVDGTHPSRALRQAFICRAAPARSRPMLDWAPMIAIGAAPEGPSAASDAIQEDPAR